MCVSTRKHGQDARATILWNDDLRPRLHVVGVETGVGIEDALVLDRIPVHLFRDVPEIIPWLDRVGATRDSRLRRGGSGRGGRDRPRRRRGLRALRDGLLGLLWRLRLLLLSALLRRRLLDDAARETT